MPLFAASPVILEEGKGEYPLGLHLDILEDKSGKWTIEEVSSPEFTENWLPSQKDVPNFGYTESAYWVRFQLHHDGGQSKEWILDVGYPLLDKVAFYLSTPSGDWITKQSGDSFPFKHREILNKNFLFRLQMPLPKQQTIYLRFQTEGTMQIPLYLWSSLALAEHWYQNQYGLGMYYGIIIVMLLYNLFLFVGVRDNTYLFYVLYLLGYILVQLTLNGLAFQYLWPEFPWWSNQSLPFFIGFLIFWLIQFTRSFLLSQIYTPKLDKAMILLMAGSIFAMGLSLFASYSVSIKVAIMPTIACVVIAPIIGMSCLKQGYTPARYFLLAFGMFLLGAFVFIFKSIGVLPSTLFTINAMQIGSAMEVILLSMGLADRINSERREKYIAQKEAAQAHQETVVAQRQAIENLHKSDNLKNEFLANTSHELRTPLNGIIGLTESILDGAHGTVSSDQVQNLRIIIQSGKRLSNLVNDILDYSKMKHQELQIDLKPVDIRSIVNVVLAISQSLVDQKPVTLINQISESIPMVQADENRMQQILYNLVGNAIKFTHQGDVSISSQTEGNFIRILVSDTGIGIPV